MKTLEEIKEHLSVVGYNRQAMMQIEVFALGGGLITPNYEFDFIRGNGDFDDFMKWYVTDDECVEEKYAKGDYIHVQDDIDVLCLTEVIDGFFGGTDGCKVLQYRLTDVSRPCSEYERASIDAKLKDNGLMYCHECEELELIYPFAEKDISNECIDCIEENCHQAIENIIANLHSKEIQGEEKDAVIKSLNALIQLGKMYE